MVRADSGGYSVVVGGVSFGPYATIEEAQTIDAYLSGGAASVQPCGGGEPIGVAGGTWRCEGGQWRLLPDAVPGPPTINPPTIYVPPRTSTAPPSAPSAAATAAGADLADPIDAVAAALGVARRDVYLLAGVAAAVLVLS